MRIQGWKTLTCAATAWAALFTVLSGCGGEGTSTPAAKGPEAASVTSVKATGSGPSPAEPAVEEEQVPEAPLAASASPEQVVAFLIDSMQAENKKHVAAILTKKARQETSRAGLRIEAKSAPGAVYEVGKVEYVGARKDGAHVPCTWTIPDDMGGSVSFNVIWVLRKQEAGWRIAGMATEPDEGESPEFLNFENPDERLMNRVRSEPETASNTEDKGPDSTRRK